MSQHYVRRVNRRREWMLIYTDSIGEYIKR